MLCSLLGLLGWGGFLLLGLDWGLDFLAHVLGSAVHSLLLDNGVLGASGFGLSFSIGFTDLLSLHLVNGLNEDVLVLELVTLGAQVELVIDVLVDLLGITISLEETSENALAAHPQDLLWHTGVPGTLSVTSAEMTT